MVTGCLKDAESTPRLLVFQVLTDAGDLTGAFKAAETLVAVTPVPRGKPTAGVGDGEPEDGLDLAAARLISSREDCSDRSLELFAAIASRFDRKNNNLPPEWFMDATTAIPEGVTTDSSIHRALQAPCACVLIPVHRKSD